jgi:hypothetical protein
MSVTINMSSYEVETIETEYSDEIMCSGWNPEVDSVALQLQYIPATQQPAIPTDLATEVTEIFLRKMYSYQN